MADVLGDQDRYIHLKEIYVDFIKRRPTSVLELVFQDAYGVKHKSNKFKEGDLVHWYSDMYIRTHTHATLTIRRALFNIRVVEIEVEFEPNVFGDDGVVGLEDSNRCLSVNFVCGSSRSPIDVTRVLGFHGRGDLASKVLRFLKPRPRLEALPPLLPPSTSDQGLDIPYVAIHRLNDDILLEIFNHYRLDEMHSWNIRLGWRKLSHVCQRWRRLMFETAFHLGMHIECTNGAPIVDTLEHLPRLPLRVYYRFTFTKQDELGVYRALQLRNRVRHIHIILSPSLLHKFLVLMGENFPILGHLSLWFTTDKSITLTLPKTFLASNLRHLALAGVGLPKRLRLLTSTASLVTLVLSDIPASSYVRPRLLVARLSSLPQLKELSIGFAVPMPRPSTERELLGDQGAPKTIPNLKTVRFRGVGAYLESFVAQIRAPLLERLDITLFNQIAFSLPYLSHLINTTERVKLPTAEVYFHRDFVWIFTTTQSSPRFEPICLYVNNKQLDWQIDCAAQICSALIPALSGVERLTLQFYEKKLPTEWENEIDSTAWHELLRLFTGVKKLHIGRALLKELSRALQLDDVGSDPGFLPLLEEIVAEDNLFSQFIDTRQVVGHPVRFSQ